MPQDYMSDGMDESAEPASEEKKESPEQEKSETDETKTGLLPIEFFQGKELKPGDTCTVKVESIEQDQVQVSYVSESETESSAESKPAEPGEAAMPDDMMG